MLAFAPKAMADSDMNFIRGNACIVNDQQKCVVEVDYSDLNIEGKPCMQYLQDRGEENVRDWKSDMELCVSQFVEKWNKDNKGALKAIAEKDEGTPLRLVVKMKRLHYRASRSGWLWFWRCPSGMRSGHIRWQQGDYQTSH